MPSSVASISNLVCGVVVPIPTYVFTVPKVFSGYRAQYMLLSASTCARYPIAVALLKFPEPK